MLFALGFLSPIDAQQDSTQVQVIEQNLKLGESHYYDLSNLNRGDTVYIYVESLSGNLDPIIGLTKKRTEFESFENFYDIKIPEAIEKGFDFKEIFSDFSKDYFIVWDDDGGKQHDAVIKYTVEDEVNLQLIVTGEYYNLVSREQYYSTFGRYRLTIGVNSPEVLTGEGTPTGHTIATESLQFHRNVQEIKGEIIKDREFIHFPLNTLDKGDTIYLYVEAVSGDLKPTIKLRNFGDKLLEFDNLDGKEDTATLKYTLKEDSENYYLVLRGDGRGESPTYGQFRLLIGTNSPQILTGNTSLRGVPVIRSPIEVEVILAIDQIVDVNQKEENFTVVGNLFLIWQDQDFTFNTEKCKCNELTFNILQFENFVKEKNHLFPRFLFLNQQGKRFTQEDLVQILPDGSVAIFERFTVKLQAPDFDFSRFPFDPQEFFIRILGMESEDYYVFKVNREFTRVGDKLGEEEWFVTDYYSEITTTKIRESKSQFNLKILAERHKNYYLYKIFLPLILIMLVSWATFFMRDYAKRVDVSAANLLVYVAYNFTFGSDLPRLGYLTFMDCVLILAFIVTSLAVVSNVALRRIESSNRRELADKIDAYITWGYPLFFLVGLLIIVTIFF